MSDRGALLTGQADIRKRQFLLSVDILESSTTTRIVFHDFNLKGQQDRQGRFIIKMLLET